ncbi:PAS domain S-box protein [Pelotomaculum propionicicum]|uniref:sensor domain-containing diguanylate cyclase/phosphohydrolase n=1 Tax=Pelotomaculum propionicicum TaxID=258475 RepID=UPI003B818B87
MSLLKSVEKSNIYYYQSRQDQEKKFNTLVENIKGVVYKINSRGRIMFVSPTVKQLTGYDVSEVVGHYLSEFVCPDDLPDAMASLKQAVKRSISSSEFRVVCKNGEIRYTRATSIIEVRNKRAKVLTGIITDITELKHKEEDLLLTRKALNSTSNPVLLTDLNGMFVLYHNDSFFKLTGYTSAEINNAGGAPVLYDSPEKAKEVYRTIIRGEPWKGEFDLRASDGRLVPVCLHTNLIKSGKRAIGCFGVFADLTGQKQAEEDRRAAHQRLHNIIEFLPDATFVIDEEGRVIEWNRAIEEMTGKSRREMLGRDDYSVLFYGVSRPMLIDLVLKPDQSVEKEYDRIIRKENSLVGEAYTPYYLRGKGAHLWGAASPVYDSSGIMAGAIETIRDISEWKKTTDMLRYYGIYDALTGLYNRNHFQEEMRHLWLNQTAGMIICDVDGLKLVNDTLGHDKGDALLFAAAGVIKKCFDKNEVVARIGGDEFAVLICDTGQKEVEKACGRIRDAIRQHNKINGDMPLSMSIGYAVTEDTSDIKALFKQADNNMYREKLHSNSSGRSAIVQTLMKTLKERDFITEGHADRLQDLVAALARSISLPESRINDLKLLSQFHDIGKVGIQDSILFKPGPLTSKEFSEMKRHCEIGYRIAMSSPDLSPIAEWILKHHEWWDGSGYPLGLKGEAIPLECRILAVADAYDAMTSDRPYRKAMSHDDALNELRKFAGKQFAPDIVEKFVEVTKSGDSFKLKSP